MSGQPDPKTWTCKRVRDKAKCGHRNPALKRRCWKCGAPRPPKRQARHMAVLRGLNFDDFVQVNGGEHCGVCGKTAKVDGSALKLYRDHEHKNLGRPRGLLCFNCNKRLDYLVTAEWCDAAAAYLRGERFKVAS